MIHNFRHFEVIDPFERIWQVEFLWQQTAISIRHADAVDVKWHLLSADQVVDKVIALPHSMLLAASKKHDRPLSDPWCMKLAAIHLQMMIQTWQDMDKTLITLTEEELEQAAQTLAGWEQSLSEEALLT